MSNPPPSASSDRADHAWYVEDREYERQEARRGRRHAFEHLDPARTALVVIDVVPFLRARVGVRPGIVPRVNRLATALPRRRQRRRVGRAGLHPADAEGPGVLAATRDRDHNATLHAVYRSYGDVRPTSEVLDLVAAGRRQVTSS